MPGDRVTTEDGRDVEFRSQRSGRAPQVVTLKNLVLVAGLFATATGVSVGGAARYVLDARVEQLITAHGKDPDAHTFLVRQLDAQIQAAANKDQEIGRLTQQLANLQQELRQTREAVIELQIMLREKRGGR
jgi:hypothetical protein